MGNFKCTGVGGRCRDPPLGRASPAPTSDIWVRLMSVHRPFFLTQTDVTAYTPVLDDCKANAGPSGVSFMNVHEPQVQCCCHTTIRFSLLRSARRGGLEPRCAAVTKSQPGSQQASGHVVLLPHVPGRAPAPWGRVSLTRGWLYPEHPRCEVLHKSSSLGHACPQISHSLPKGHGANSSQAALALPAGLRFLL